MNNVNYRCYLFLGVFFHFVSSQGFSVIRHTVFAFALLLHQYILYMCVYELICSRLPVKFSNTKFAHVRHQRGNLTVFAYHWMEKTGPTIMLRKGRENNGSPLNDKRSPAIFLLFNFVNFLEKFSSRIFVDCLLFRRPGATMKSSFVSICLNICLIRH